MLALCLFTTRNSEDAVTLAAEVDMLSTSSYHQTLETMWSTRRHIHTILHHKLDRSPIDVYCRHTMQHTNEPYWTDMLSLTAKKAFAHAIEPPSPFTLTLSIYLKILKIFPRQFKTLINLLHIRPIPNRSRTFTTSFTAHSDSDSRSPFTSDSAFLTKSLHRS